MGEYLHHIIIVMGQDKAEVVSIQEKAKEIFPPVMVSSICTAPFNDFHQFMVGTDGHKVGWDDEEETFESKRQKFYMSMVDVIGVHWYEIVESSMDVDAHISNDTYKFFQTTLRR